MKQNPSHLPQLQLTNVLAVFLRDIVVVVTLPIGI